MQHLPFLPFGEVLKTYRKQKHLTQRQLAERVGVHYNTIWAWEQGDYLPETKGIVLELGRQLGLEDSQTRHLLESSLTALSSRWNVPYQRNPYFTGRTTILQQMHTLLFRNNDAGQVYRLALSGLAGIGKTQTAVEYAYRHALDYTSIFWLQAETADHLRSNLIALAELLALPERQEHDQNRIVSAVRRWLTSHCDWLLILDTVQEIAAIKDLVPIVQCGSLLLTTRLPTLGTLAQILSLEPMTKQEGVHFLLRRTAQTRRQTLASALDDEVPEPEQVAAEHLVRMMDGLPLALDQAGAYIEKTQTGLSDFLHVFQRYPMRLLHAREAYEEHPVSVAKTFLLAFEHLQQTNPMTADLLTLSSLLPLDGIPEELVTEANAYLGPSLSALGRDAWLYHQALQDLLAHSFVRRFPETRRLVLHRLVQVVIREQLEAEAQQQWAVRLLQAANTIFPHWKYAIFPDGTIDDWPRNQRLLPLVFACEQLIEQYQVHIPEALHLLARAAHYLRLRGDYQQAEALCQHAMKLNEAVHGSNQVETAMLLSVQMMIDYDLGRYEEAGVLCQRALALYEQFLDATSFLGVLCHLCGHYQKAEALFLRVLAFHEQQETGVEIALPLFSLANLYLTQKQFEKAEPLFQRSRNVRERELGPEHVDMGTSLNGLAHLYAESGRYEEAASFYQHTLTIYERALGPEHPSVAIVLMHFGQLFFVQQRYHEAQVLYQRCFTLQERVYSPDHIHCISLLLQLGQLALAQKRYREAEECLQRALSLAEGGLTPGHELTADIRCELSRLNTLQQSFHET